MNSATKNLQISPQEAASELLKRRRARGNLVDFSRYSMFGYIPSDHHHEICKKLEAVERGEIKRLMIFMPPRHGKSELASRRFPAWFLGKNPKKSIIAASYNSELAGDFGREVRNIVNSPEYSNLYSNKLAADSQAAGRWHTDEGGGYVAAGVGTAITGRGAHVLLIDDPFKDRESADSQLIRDKTYKWYLSTAYTRLEGTITERDEDDLWNDHQEAIEEGEAFDGAIILIQTRWHEDDLAGRLLEDMKNGADQWDVLSLPAIKDEHKEYEEALWPGKYPLKRLQSIRKALTERDWTALYQQNPTPDEGIYFTRESFRWYDKLPDHLTYYGGGDYAVSKDTGDFSEMGIFGVAPNDNIYIADWWGKQESTNVVIETMLDLVLKWNVCMWGAETGVIRKAIEPFLELRMRQKRAFTILEWIPTMANNKEAGARTFQALADSGLIYLPTGEQWALDLVNQLVSFPSGVFDDKVDACTNFARMINNVWAANPSESREPKPVDRYDKAFNDEDNGDDSWKWA